MQVPKLIALTLAAIAIAMDGTNVCAISEQALFAAKELQLQAATPREADFDRPFEAPLPARVAGTEGKRLVHLANCRDYLEVRGRIVGSDTDANYRVLRLQTVPCTALALLKSATAASRTALPADFLVYTSTDAYPATLWPAVSDDERRRLAQAGVTLHMATGKPVLRKVAAEALELETNSFGLHLTLLARGDFDHDGWEDAAFRWEGYALQGSYTDARLVVLTRTEGDGILHELPLDKLLPGHQ